MFIKFLEAIANNVHGICKRKHSVFDTTLFEIGNYVIVISIRIFLPDRRKHPIGLNLEKSNRF